MGNAPIIDTHAHLDMSVYDQDRDDMLARAAAAGVVNIITVGIDLESSKRAVALSECYPNVYAAVGIHPHDVNAITMNDIDAIEKIGMNPRVVAVGETGLDFYRDLSPRDRQIIAFGWHLDLADEMGLPVIIHCREAANELLQILRERVVERPGIGQYRGVIHCFNGDAATVQAYLDMGFHISLGGYIGYPKSTALYEVIKGIPRDRMLTETDCPFLPPQDYRGKRNEPAYLRLTVKKLAEIRKETYEDVARVTTENARRLFGITANNQ
ncbi:MAG: TatD family hydrolase [Dehalococcoidales bacterium]|nr:TatD family hydrolase [Dehalococcoidales bacterium]